LNCSAKRHVALFAPKLSVSLILLFILYQDIFCK
jgi:hypothetical protein